MSNSEQIKALHSLLASVEHLHLAVEAILATSPALETAAECAADVSLIECLTRAAKGIGETRRLLGTDGRQVAAQTVGQSENVVGWSRKVIERQERVDLAPFAIDVQELDGRSARS